MADQNSSNMNAIHGTPGWRELESSMAKGDVTRFFRVRHNSPTASRSRPQIQPTSTTAGKNRNRNLPTAPQNELPLRTNWNTYACQSRIQERPPQTQPHTVWRIQLHCAV